MVAEYIDLFAYTFLAVLTIFVVFWLISIPLKDVSIVDMIWAPACALPGWIAFCVTDGAEPRKLLITALVTFWAIRLCWHITKRNWGHGEDPRYTKLRSFTKPGQSFHWVSLQRVFLLQAGLAWIVSLPVQVAQVYTIPVELGVFAYVGATVSIIGILFEVIGDSQLKRFKSRPENKGKLMDQGLWSWTRHPNYFGDATLWAGLMLISCDNPVGFITIISPLIMGYFLLNVTGKKLLERGMRRRYPDYAAYEERTSGFFPLPPKRAGDGSS